MMGQNTGRSAKHRSSIAIVNTGGTFASHGDGNVVVVPAGDRDLPPILAEIAHDPHIDVDLTFDLLMNKFSEDIVPSDWMTIAQRVADLIDQGYDGIVVTHGTDTMAYTGAALSFMLHHCSIPVVLTGASLPPDEPGSNAESNLRESILVAAHSGLEGAFVAFDSIVYRAGRIRKLGSMDQAFQSVNVEPVALIQDDLLIPLDQNPAGANASGAEFRPDIRLNSQVVCFKVYPGFSPFLIDMAVEQGFKGVILEIFTTGTACAREERLEEYSLTGAIRRTIDKGIPVFVTSHQDGDLRMDKYLNSDRLKNAGVISLRDMTTESAIVKLMWVGHTTEFHEVEKRMLSDLTGEISAR